jgi:hypothetical protein
LFPTKEIFCDLVMDKRLFVEHNVSSLFLK